ncbi:MAG TPA: ribosome-associated translation inhibitor RaiA [Clostridia bacterium]|nr:ribosome-associated translation inhibitor RaiA [Clostridia bacterium]
MKITIVGRKCSPRQSFKDRVEKKLSKIDRFFGDEAEANVTVTVEKSSTIVEITVKNNGMIFRSEDRSQDMIEAFDNCVDALVRQIRKNKSKVEKRLRSGAFDNLFQEENVEEETDFDVVRTKSIPLKPQSIDEAILQMNMLDHEFYMFLDAVSEKINVVYKRNDGGYGVLMPSGG